MMGEEIVVVAIVFGSIVAIVFMGIIGSIIKAAIKRKSSGNITENREFLAALREFKENTDRRLQNLEAIVSGDEPVPGKSSQKKKIPSERKSSIEIEIENESAKEEKTGQSGKLKNMLNQ
jgi:hypothetical protein